MNDATHHARGGLVPFGLLLALGLVLARWVLGAQIKATRLSDRFVTVRGLAERNVKSDLAVWPIRYKEAGDDLPSLYARTENDKKTILEFLGQAGIPSSEIELGIVRVVDNQANEFGGGEKAAHRYIVEQQLTVRTNHVDSIAAAAQQTMQLLQKGVVLDSGPGGGFGQRLSYKFTGLNSIKPDMITEATRNARVAAERFAADSGSKIGSIRQATQGIFSILAADQSGAVSESSNDAGYDADSSLMKTVRVVTTVDYYLEK